ARRDSLQNDPVSLFFGPVFNKSSQELTATARAVIYSGDVTSLKKISGVDAHILPVALDYHLWTTFTNATAADASKGITTGPNGGLQPHVYPNDVNAPGSFGLVDVGPPANDAPAFRSWIDDGETPNDIQYLLDHNMLPVGPGYHESKLWKVGPGLKSTLLADF